MALLFKMRIQTVLFGFLFFSSPLFAAIPDCLDLNNSPMGIDNNAVIRAIQTTENNFQMRARVNGKIGTLYDDRSDHNHFEAIIGPNPSDKIEIVYNKGFGKLPVLKEGMSVEVCGDYITASAQTGPYPPSPNGAIIHYVHKSTNKHLSGYVVIDGKLYGWGRGFLEPFLEPSLEFNF